MNSSIKKEEKIKKYRGRRKPLLIWVDEETDEALREFIAREYGTIFRGIISYVVEQAILSYISHPSHTHKHTNPSHNHNPTGINKIQRVLSEIKEYIADKYDVDFDEVNECPKVFVEEAIREVRGSDPRTVKKWLADLERSGYIQIIGQVVKFQR